jgi:hypothetical protein
LFQNVVRLCGRYVILAKANKVCGHVTGEEIYGGFVAPGRRIIGHADALLEMTGVRRCSDAVAPDASKRVKQEETNL